MNAIFAQWKHLHGGMEEEVINQCTREENPGRCEKGGSDSADMTLRNE